MSHYQTIVVETFYDSSRGTRSVRPVAGQPFPTTMKVSCSKRMRSGRPLGTKFQIQVKETNKEGGIPFLYCHHASPYTVVG